MVRGESVECPKPCARVLWGKEALRNAAGIFANDIMKSPVAVFAGGDAETIADHPGNILVDDTLFTVKGIAEDPYVSPIVERDGVGSIGTEPSVGLSQLQRKPGGALIVAHASMRCSGDQYKEGHHEPKTKSEA